MGGNGSVTCTDGFTFPSPRAHLQFLIPPNLATVAVIIVLVVLTLSLVYRFNYSCTSAVFIFICSTLGAIIGSTIASRRNYFEVDREGVWRCVRRSRSLVMPRERTGVEVRLHFWFIQPFYLRGADLGAVRVSVPPVHRRYLLGVYPRTSFDDLVSRYAAMCEAWDTASVAAPALRVYEGR